MSILQNWFGSTKVRPGRVTHIVGILLGDSSKAPDFGQELVLDSYARKNPDFTKRLGRKLGEGTIGVTAVAVGSCAHDGVPDAVVDVMEKLEIPVNHSAYVQPLTSAPGSESDMSFLLVTIHRTRNANMIFGADSL